MSRKKIVAGNWKMNMTIDESNDLINKLKEVSENNVEIKIAPSFTNLYCAISLLENSGIEVIAQNVHSEKRGAYTGEISAEMLKSIGVNTVIIGHSERRKHFNETDTILSEKVKAAIENSLNIIFCIGEEFSERESGNHFEIIKNQLTTALMDLNNAEIKNVVIAYEPVWAIGTGMTANTNQIQEMHEFIRKLINKKFDNEISDRIRILYGGSVKPNNAKEIFSLNDVDGGLIGGASLNFADFHNIISAANG
ncbi:MAG: triose-phosphate isomerase [Flavobacteriaceae bacterium]|nr:triose-phosphate isomerase [Flavobacteriaceae bacterium]|tara:strand:+ start:2174 stop:2929 length:756 start_codon:yes stop_codon:yes gene_type:complete